MAAHKRNMSELLKKRLGAAAAEVKPIEIPVNSSPSTSTAPSTPMPEAASLEHTLVRSYEDQSKPNQSPALLGKDQSEPAPAPTHGKGPSTH